MWRTAVAVLIDQVRFNQSEHCTHTHTTTNYPSDEYLYTHTYFLISKPRVILNGLLEPISPIPALIRLEVFIYYGERSWEHLKGGYMIKA